MKALTLSAPNELRYGEVPDPEVHAGEVLIDVRACGVCGSDIHGMDGSSGRRIPPSSWVTRLPGPSVGWVPA